MPWDFWLIFFILGVLIPWRGRARLRRLLLMPVKGTKEKLALYGATIGFQWLLTALVAWRAIARGLTPSDLGVAGRISADVVVWGLVGTALLCTFQWFNLRRVGHMSGPTTELMRKLAERLLPANAVEFAPYCALALTAGLCEEFLYRGFAMAALSKAGVPTWAVVVISSVLFGLAHAYQGRSGVIGTGLLGLLFAAARIVLNSLAPVVLWHAGVDVIAGVAGPRFLVSNVAVEEPRIAE
jgi:membrane protease YdiL (CAAX protease family)